MVSGVFHVITMEIIEAWSSKDFVTDMITYSLWVKITWITHWNLSRVTSFMGDPLLLWNLFKMSQLYVNQTSLEGPPVLEDQILLSEEDVLSRQVPLYRNQLCTMHTSLLRKPFNQHRMTACCTVPITVFADNVHRQKFFFIQILIF